MVLWYSLYIEGIHEIKRGISVKEYRFYEFKKWDEIFIYRKQRNQG